MLSEFFKIKRGLATGNNKYFILSAQEVERRELPKEAFKPILPSPRYVPDDEVKGDKEGDPVLVRRLFLLDPPWEEEEIRERYPRLWDYLEEGKAEGVADRYLCRHRTLWYTQEFWPPAPFVCTYLGRSDKSSGRPFRFILNNSRATAANVYLMLYPKAHIQRALQDRPGLKRKVWEYLNQICPQAILGEGRVYGGGLHKLEPKELGNVPAEAVAELLLGSARPRRESSAAGACSWNQLLSIPDGYDSLLMADRSTACGKRFSAAPSGGGTPARAPARSATGGLGAGPPGQSPRVRKRRTQHSTLAGLTSNCRAAAPMLIPRSTTIATARRRTQVLARRITPRPAADKADTAPARRLRVAALPSSRAAAWAGRRR